MSEKHSLPQPPLGQSFGHGILAMRLTKTNKNNSTQNAGVLINQL